MRSFHAVPNTDTITSLFQQSAAAQQRLDAANRSHTTHVHVGQAPEVIARLAGDLACDLIVMGTHGRTGIAELVMGSVASRVLHLAPCPVLLVK